MNKKILLYPDETYDWVNTIDSIHIHEKECSPVNKWRRTGKKNNTADIVFLIIKLPLGKERTIPDQIKKRVRCFFDAMKMRKSNIVASMILDRVCGRPGGESGGLAKFLFNKGKVYRKTTLKITKEDIRNHSPDGPAYEYNTPLKKNMVDLNIKYFLSNHIGIQAWYELNKELKRYCYRDNSRQRPSEWDGIAEKIW